MPSKVVNAAWVVVATVVTFFAAYWYWSPFLAIRQMQAAVNTRDVDTFNERVDYLKVRESLKAQLADKLANKLGKADDAGTGLADLGTAIGMSLVNPLVDAMVSPQTVMRAMRDGQLAPTFKQIGDASSHPSSKPNGQSSTGAVADKPKWTYERKDANHLIAYLIAPRKPGEKPADQLGLVFQRSGFADWKLTELRIPALNE